MVRIRAAVAVTVLTAVVVVAVALPSAVLARARSPHFAPATVAALNSIVEKGRAASGTPGMAVGIWVAGKGTYVHAFGTANVQAGSPFAVADHVRIASITKTFTATAVLELVDRGRLGLSDHLSSFVKGVPHGRQITIGQLLDMTAGVYDFTNDAAFLAQYQANPLLAFTPKDRHHSPACAFLRTRDFRRVLGQQLFSARADRREGDAPDARERDPDSHHRSLAPAAYQLSPRAGHPDPFSRGYFAETPSSPL
jgi:D-alanyl-D-alanine carboxypeptidase